MEPVQKERKALAWGTESTAAFRHREYYQETDLQLPDLKYHAVQSALLTTIVAETVGIWCQD